MKRKINKGKLFLGILIIGVLVFAAFFISNRLDNITAKDKNSFLYLKSSDIRFIDAFWSVVDWPGCELAGEENRVMQDIGIPHNINYIHDHTCKYFLTTYYSDGKVGNRMEVTPNNYRLKDLNTFDSYKIEICCSDRYGNSFCKSRDVPSKCWKGYFIN